MRRLFAALLPLAVLVSSPAYAGDHPDLNGFWFLDFGEVSPVAKDLVAKLPPNTVVIEDTGVVEYPQNEFGGLKIKPDALAKAKTWKPTDEMQLTRVCMAPSVVYSIQGPFPFEIYQTDQMIVFRYEYFDQVRIVFMDGRGHPPAEAAHTKVGHSIGHWEGEDLVIDTTHILPSTITNNGLDHSANVRMVERYRKLDDGTLLATQWFEDPETLDNNGARVIQWKKQEGQYINAYDCDPSIALEYQQLDAQPDEAAGQ